MSIRPEVQFVLEMGPLPSSDEAQVDDVDRRGSALNQIQPPLTQEEADELVRCFGPDECFGLGFMLLHLIETAPSLPAIDPAVLATSEWLQLVWNPQQIG